MVGGSAARLLTARQCSTDVRMTMLWTLFVVLLLLWLLGVVSSYTLGGFIHLLLVLAVVAVLVQLITGRRAV
jgi:formate hydrogenlyase subunit 4